MRDCTQLSPVQGLGGSRGEKEEEKYRQKGENEERDSGGEWILMPFIL